MPDLQQFEAGSGQLTISDRGAESFAQAGRRAGVAAREIGEDIDRTVRPMGEVFIQHQQDMDVSNAYAAMSTARANAEDNWTKATAQPDALDHPELGQAFLQQYQQSLSEIASHATTEQGRRIAERLVSQQVLEMHQRVASDMGDLAAARWTQNDDTFRNNTLSRVVQDPSSLPQAISDYQEFVQSTIPANVPAAMRARIIEAREGKLQDITAAAYLSAIHTGESEIAAGQPPTAMDAVQKMADGQVGFDHMSAEFKADLQARIDTGRQQGAERLRVNQGAQKAQVEQDTMAQIGRIRASLLPDANGNPPDPKAAQAALAQLHALANSPNATVAATAGREAEAIGNVIRTQADDRLKGTYTQDNPSALADINARESIPQGQPGALTKVQLDDMRTNHLISDTTYQQKTRRLEDLTNNPLLRETETRLTAFMKGSIYPALTGDMSGSDPATSLMGSAVDPKTKAAYEIALNQTISQFEAMVNQGATPENAYKIITDPTSAGSVWHVMPAWKVYAEQGPEYAAQHPITYGNPTGAPITPQAAPAADPSVAKVHAAGPIKPGESWAAYKARAGL